MYGMPSKFSSDVITSLTHFIADYNTQLAPNTIQRIHSDAGTEFKSSIFKTWQPNKKSELLMPLLNINTRMAYVNVITVLSKTLPEKSWFMPDSTHPISIMPFNMHALFTTAFLLKAHMFNLAKLQLPGSSSLASPPKLATCVFLDVLLFVNATKHHLTLPDHPLAHGTYSKVFLVFLLVYQKTPLVGFFTLLALTPQ